MQTTERHKICAEAARDAAERLEAGARNPCAPAWQRIHYAFSPLHSEGGIGTYSSTRCRLCQHFAFSPLHSEGGIGTRAVSSTAGPVAAAMS